MTSDERIEELKRGWAHTKEWLVGRFKDRYVTETWTLEELLRFAKTVYRKAHVDAGTAKQQMHRRAQAAEARVVELERENETLRSLLHARGADNKALATDLAAAAARVEALRPYVQHLPECAVRKCSCCHIEQTSPFRHSFTNECTCGLASALEGVKEK